MEGIALMYPKMPPVPFISGRELLQRFNVLKDFPDKGKNSLMAQSIQLPEYPETKKFIRSNTEFNCMIVEPLSKPNTV